MPLNRTTDRTATLVGHVMTNSFHKVNQSGVIDGGSSDHDFIFYSRKTLKSHKHSNILVQLLKYYTEEKF